MNRKLKLLLIKIHLESKKKMKTDYYPQELKYSDFGLAFQDKLILDARALGFVYLNSSKGFCLKKKYLSENSAEFLEQLKI